MITHEEIPPLHINDDLVVRLHVDSQYTYFGHSYLTQGGMHLLAENNNAKYREETIYINHIQNHEAITIMDRNGIAVSLQYESSVTSRDFIIRKVYHFSEYSLRSVIACVQASAELETRELEQIRECLSSLSPHQQHATVMIDYTITPEELQERGGTLYHYQTDLLISTNNSINVTAHPYSPAFMNVGTFGIEHDYQHQKEFNLKIRYVNHERKACPKYLNLFGKVFTLYPQKDAPARKLEIKSKTQQRKIVVAEDYLQIFYSSKHESGNQSVTGVDHIKLSLEEAEQVFGIFNTYEEALHCGNIELSRKEENARLLHQIELLKNTNTIEKARLDAEEHQRKSDLSQLSHHLEIKRKELELQALQQKEAQARIDLQMQELDNERKQLDLKRKEQDEFLEREQKLFNERLRMLREEHDARAREEAQRTKDHYEQKSHHRKDFSEIIKLIGTVIAFVGGAIMAYDKLKPKEN